MKAERGSARIILELSDGKVTVKHADTGEVLRSGICPEGGWKDIWSAILLNSVTQAEANTNSHPSRSVERRLDVQRSTMSDFDRDKIGNEDNDGVLRLRD